MRHFARLAPAAVIAYLFGAALAWASITGSISGVVTDQNGGVIVGAKVTALETQTGVRSEITTDSKGFYNFPALPVGKYDVEVQAPGFKLYRQSGLVIDVNSALRVDVSLQVGEVSERVTVLSESVHVDTESTQNGQVIEGSKIVTVPLNGRSYTDLLSLQPGVVPSAYTNQAPDTMDRAPSGDLHQGNVSVNGQRESSNGFMVNGANVEEGKNNGTSVVPNLDSIEEFRIITNNFDAEYGNYSGGQVNVATKSGTNSFHGSAFEFLRNTDFDARNFYNPAPGQKGDFKQNQFGGTGGGPIKRDKLFFFGDYQGTRQIRGNTVTTPVPSATVLPDASGNVNALSLFNSQSDGSAVVNGAPWASVLTGRLQPTTGQTVTAGEPYWTPTCASTAACVFPGGLIPKGAILNLSNNLLPLIPSVSSAAATATGSDFFTSSLPQRLRDDKGAIRIDDNTRFGVISGYYFLDDYNLNSPTPSNIGANVPGFGASTSGRAQLATISDTKTFGSTAVNEFRISFTRSAVQIGKPTQAIGPGTMAKLGFVAPATVGGVFNGGIAPVVPALDGVPSICLCNLGTSIGVPSDTPFQFNNTYQVQDNFTKVLGTHTWKFGGQYHYDQINYRNLFGQDGNFTFDGSESGVDYVDFLLGAVGSGGFIQASKQILDSRSKYAGLFVQDSWRVKSSLTFNYGLRWEFSTPWYDTQSKIDTIVPGQQSKVYVGNPSQGILGAPKGLVFPGDAGIPKTLAPTQYNAFSPRIGAAYSPAMTKGFLSKLTGGPGKTSIRGGFGMFRTAFEDLSQFQEVGDLPSGLFWAPGGQKLFEAPFFDRVNGSDGQKFPFSPTLNASPKNPNTTFDWTPFLPLDGNAEVSFFHKNRLPYAEHFDLNVQRQLGANTLLSVGYVGTMGHKLIAFVNSNPADHNLCLFLLDMPDESESGSWYHRLQPIQ
jgi:outer membrane receptor protein involved in Fe transport